MQERFPGLGILVILFAMSFTLFSYFLFWEIWGVFSHVCLPNYTLHCGFTPLVICFDIKIRITSINLIFLSLLYVKVISLKITLKPKWSFYFSSALSKALKYNQLMT